MKLIVGLLINSITLYVADWLFEGISISSTSSLIFAAIVFGIINTLIKPLLHLISLPITIITFGLFSLVINALLLGLSAWFVPGFSIDSFWTALLASIVISIISTLLHSLTHPRQVI